MNTQSRIALDNLRWIEWLSRVVGSRCIPRAVLAAWDANDAERYQDYGGPYRRRS
jgi:hypothetical protein